MKKLFAFIGIIISTICNGNADQILYSCPAGCFCINDGKYDASYGMHEDICTLSAQRKPAYCETGRAFYSYRNGLLGCPGNTSQAANYYMDEFTELYEGYYGFYGFIGNDLILMPSNENVQGRYQCPATHPMSAKGAKSLYNCFKYDANGNKVYYGTGQTINCAPGQYLPANAKTCSNCDASKNQICAGGSFEQSKTIQGLRINCNPGQYLPANSTQCNACDTGKYSCSGGIYEFNANIDQGLTIQHNGYINTAKPNGGLHQYTTCNPGQYIPATTNTCTACTGDYACPGGIFYTDATYTQDRGRILCTYGTANPNHTACVAQSTLPSFMKNKILKSDVNDTPVASNTNIQPTSPTTSTTNSSNGQTNTTGTTNTIQPSTTSITAQNISLPLTTAEKKFDFGNLVSPFADRSATQQKRQPVQTTHGRATRITPQIKKTTISPQSAQQSPAHRSNNNPHRPSPRQ